jgi:hypothetical protein
MTGATNGVSPDSPLARLRANYEARQAASEDRYVDVWEDGSLVARFGRSEDMASARGVLRTLTYLANNEAAAAIDVTVDDLADVLAVTTISLHTRQPDGELEPLLDSAGQPLRFDASFGQAIGVPEVVTPRGAVLVAFTDGVPPQIDAARLMLCATYVAGVLAAGRMDAEAVLGEPSALRS